MEITPEELDPTESKGEFLVKLENNWKKTQVLGEVGKWDEIFGEIIVLLTFTKN